MKYEHELGRLLSNETGDRLILKMSNLLVVNEQPACIRSIHKTLVNGKVSLTVEDYPAFLGALGVSSKRVITVLIRTL